MEQKEGTIRKAETRDIPAIVALLHEIHELHVAGRPDVFQKDLIKYDENALQKTLKDPLRPVYVFEDQNGAVSGYVFGEIKFFPETGVKMMYVDDLCVDQKDQSQGIGTRLMQKIEAVAREASCKNINLNVWAFNENARRFYENLGFMPMRLIVEKQLS